MFLLHNNSYEIKKTKEKGLGVFTKEKIAFGTVISDYLGKVIKTAEYDLDEDKKGLYLMYYSDTASIYPDLSVPGPHLLNHSCSPNCWLFVYCGHTLFFALRDINPGEELTISYLLDADIEACKMCPHICKCGSTNCTGTMHLSKKKYVLWQMFQNKMKMMTKRKRIVFGKTLSPLKSYPSIIPIDPLYALLTAA